MRNILDLFYKQSKLIIFDISSILTKSSFAILSSFNVCLW